MVRIQVLLVWYIFTVLCKGLEIDHWGTHFVVTFINNINNGLSLVVAARDNTDVRITYYRSAVESSRFSLTAGQSHRLSLPNWVQTRGSFSVWKKRAISVESSAKVSVYGFNDGLRRNTSDGFLVLPVPSLGEHYMAVNVPSGRSQIAVVAVEDSTSINITVKTVDGNKCYDNGTWLQIMNGQVFHFQMMAYDVANIYCSRDTTGSVITSNKPIAVISGNRCSQMPNGAHTPSGKQCDHMVEMLPPISEFGTEYVIVAPIGNTAGSWFRVLALDQGTEFAIRSNVNYIDSGQHADFFLLNSESLYFTSNKPVLVVLSMNGVRKQPGYSGDAFLMVIPPVNKYTNYYVFNTDAFRNIIDDHHVIIIVHKDYVNTISPTITNFQSINSSEYRAYVKTNVTDVETYYSTTDKPFCVLAYGFAYEEAYGFPAGMKLTDYSGFEECSNVSCVNGGWCLEVGLSYICRCLEGFTGRYCEQAIWTTEARTTGTPTTVPQTDDPTTEPPTPINHDLITEPQTIDHTTEPQTGDQKTDPQTSGDLTLEPKTHNTTTDPHTTDDPTTESQNTDDPTTEPQTTDDPTTEPQTTDDQIVEPQTDNPTTELQITDGPTTESLTTDDPTTEPPTTDDPTTEPQTTDDQTTEPLTTDDPIVEPQTDNPTTELQITDGLTTESLTTDDQTTEPQTIDNPTTELQITDGPTTESLTTDDQTTEPQTSELSLIETTPRYKSGLKESMYRSGLGLCKCPCLQKGRNISDSLTYARINKKYLYVEKETLSKTRRMKKSSENINQSETNIGASSIIIFILLLTCVIFSDVSRICMWFWHRKPIVKTVKDLPLYIKGKQ